MQINFFKLRVVICYGSLDQPSLGRSPQPRMQINFHRTMGHQLLR